MLIVTMIPLSSKGCKSMLATRSFLFLVVRPGAPSSVLAPSSKARSPVRSFQRHPSWEVTSLFCAKMNAAASGVS